MSKIQEQTLTGKLPSIQEGKKEGQIDATDDKLQANEVQHKTLILKVSHSATTYSKMKVIKTSYIMKNSFIHFVLALMHQNIVLKQLTMTMTRS